MTGTMWGQRVQHGTETTETTAMGTTWGPSRGYGDNVGTTGMTQGRCGDDGDDMGTTGTTWGPWGHMEWRPRRQRRPQSWGPSGGYGDDVGMTWMTRG